MPEDFNPGQGQGQAARDDERNQGRARAEPAANPQQERDAGATQQPRMSGQAGQGELRAALQEEGKGPGAGGEDDPERAK
ncbi:MAG: hypothetical protein QM796_03955 [Chthoniobacteraceae bacterium]